MKYKYTGAMDPANPSAPWRFRPLVSVEVFGVKGSIALTGLIDSGADNVILNAEIAPLIGIDLSACERAEMIGISGVPQISYKAETEIQVGHLERITLPVLFIENLPMPCLLGQEGFFDAYRIKFERDHKTFEIVPVKK